MERRSWTVFADDNRIDSRGCKSRVVVRGRLLPNKAMQADDRRSGARGSRSKTLARILPVPPNEQIANAANTLAPAIFTLRKLGFVVTRETHGGSEQWRAAAPSLVAVADDPLQLLGLVTLRSTRGASWPCSDAEVSSVLRDYYPDQQSG